VGDWASGRFRLENEEDRDVELKIGIGEFTTGHDDRRFPVPVTVRRPGASETLASDLRLPAGERRVFEIRVQLDAATFKPGLTYVGEIHVLRDGRQVAELILELSVQ
jgi:hypothetical protein